MLPYIVQLSDITMKMYVCDAMVISTETGSEDVLLMYLNVISLLSGWADRWQLSMSL